MRVLQRLMQVAIRITAVAEGSTREPRHAAHMAGSKGNAKSIGRGVRQSFDAVRPEIVILALLPIRNHWRASGLELRNSIPNGLFVQRLEARVHAVASRGNRIQQMPGARDAPD